MENQTPVRLTETNIEGTIRVSVDSPFYVLPRLELDVEFDYANPEELDEARAELQQMIREQQIPEQIGSISVREDDVIYVPATGEIVYADCLSDLPF